jgi:hypothetical protein
MRTELNKNAALATDQKVVQGVGKHFAKVKSLTLAGTSYTPAALKALFQAEIEANNALDQSRAQLKELVASTLGTRTNASAARKALRMYILGNYGGGAVQVLEDFGMSPPKPKGPRTAEAKAQSAAKAKVTRALRAAAMKLVAGASSAAQATSPAHVVQAPGPAQPAAPAATSTPQQQA